MSLQFCFCLVYLSLLRENIESASADKVAAGDEPFFLPFYTLSYRSSRRVNMLKTVLGVIAVGLFRVISFLFLKLVPGGTASCKKLKKITVIDPNNTSHVFQIRPLESDPLENGNIKQINLYFSCLCVFV